MSLETLLQSLKTAVTDEACKTVLDQCKNVIFSESSLKKELCRTAVEECIPFWTEHYVMPAAAILATTVIGGAALYCCASLACCALSCIGDCLVGSDERPRHRAR